MKRLDDLSETEILEIVSVVSDFEEAWLNKIEPDDAEFESVSKFNNDQSAYFMLLRTAHTNHVFRGHDLKGTIIHRYPNGVESIPFYPSKRWVKKDLSCEYPIADAVQFSAKEWTQRYLLEMASDGLMVELLPQPQNMSLLIEPRAAYEIFVDIQSAM